MITFGRSWEAGSDYRYGFNTQEQDDEVYGCGNFNTALFWGYDTRLGMRWNRDPKSNPSLSNYSSFANNPIWLVDIYGDTTNYYTAKGKFLGTLYGDVGINDRIIKENEFNKITKEKYGWENVWFGFNNHYLNDDVIAQGKTWDDFIWDPTEMETYLNNQDNVTTQEIDLNSDIGYMIRAVYAEMRGGDNNAKSIVAESIRNRTQLNEGTYERSDGTYQGVVNKFYDVSKSGNGTYKVFSNPYNYAVKNDTEMAAWQSSVCAALQAHNGNSSVGQGVIFYHSTSSTHWDDNSKLQKISLGISVSGIKGLWKLK